MYNSLVWFGVFKSWPIYVWHTHAIHQVLEFWGERSSLPSKNFPGISIHMLQIGALVLLGRLVEAYDGSKCLNFTFFAEHFSALFTCGKVLRSFVGSPRLVFRERMLGIFNQHLPMILSNNFSEVAFLLGRSVGQWTLGLCHEMLPIIWYPISLDPAMGRY